MRDAEGVRALAAVEQTIQAFADGWGPNGWDVNIMADCETILRKNGFVDDRTPGFADPNDWCWDEHRGPVVYYGSEPIDGGLGVSVKCETCGATGDSSFDLDDINWNEDR